MELYGHDFPGPHIMSPKLTSQIIQHSMGLLIKFSLNIIPCMGLEINRGKYYILGHPASQYQLLDYLAQYNRDAVSQPPLTAMPDILQYLLLI